MDYMFSGAVSFNQKLCVGAWVHSKASKKSMFVGSLGSISRSVCKSTPSPVTTRQYASRQPITERELIARTTVTTSVTTSAITSTIASMMTCPKCGTFKKSGRVSCCASGGAWHKNCGGAGNRNVDHRWFEGADACKRKFNVVCM